MREIIPGLLWLGNAFEARDVRSVLAAGIEIIVDLAIDELPIQFPREITYCRFPLLDGEGNTPGLLRVAINTISDFLQQKIPLLVACSGGMSRSPLLTAAALALVRNLTFESAINVVTKAGPHDFSPALWKDVKQFVAEQRESSNLPRLNLVVVRSWNALRAVEFYTRIGLMFVEEQHGKGPIHWAADHGLIVLEIYPAQSEAEVDQTTRLGFTLKELEPVIEAMKQDATSIVTEPRQTTWGLRAVVKDPDGRSVELLQSLNSMS